MKKILKMDISIKTPILVVLILYVNYVSAGHAVPQPDKLSVDILDGEVIVHWKHPVDAPSDSQYNVQMAKHSGEWDVVDSCRGITKTYCDLSSLIHDYRGGYKVRVQLVAGDDVSMWKQRKFLPSASDLHPPSYSLWATSSTLTVHVHPKPVLRQLFPFGVTYTVYLEERGHHNKNTTAYLKDDMGKNQWTFSSLHWGREYCVSIKVEGNGALSASPVSPPKCLLLPEQEWFIAAVSSMSILGVLAFVAIMAAILLFYLRRPEKSPAALKSPISGWLPLSVGEGTMEVVTDKGWFLSSYRTEVKNCIKDPLTIVVVKEDNGEEEDRRTSMDSGVGMESNSAAHSGGGSPMRQEDSGCGSLGGPESSTSSKTDYPLQAARTEVNIVRNREDSGLGLDCQLDSSSMNLDGHDSGSLKECVALGNYCKQSHTAVQIPVCNKDEAMEQISPDIVLAEVITGYRAGPQSCICSGADQCTWCHKLGHNDTEVIKQYKAVFIENELLDSKWDFADLDKRGLTFSSYFKNTQTDTVMIDDFETTFLQLGETFPLLTTLTPPSLVEGAQDFNMNNVCLSLCDVELKTD